ncbi:MAG: hypothetical protein IH586_17365, partial [Anaerolineaceae bacterium]|nr:hypothetical protein [Anaerolineaceae bacterium]
MPAGGTAQAQEEGGYWELISVDTEESPPADFYTYTISRGSGTVKAASEGDSFQATMTWTEPGQRYAGGQSIDLTISAKIDEYNWHDDNDGYLHIGLNYMNASISARIDDPGINRSGVTRGAISLTGPQGEYSAKVNTDYGKIVVGSQTIQVSAKFPPGGSDGDKKSIYVNCDAGMNRYNYQWVGKDSEAMQAPPPAIPESIQPTPEPESSPPAPKPAPGRSLWRTIVAVGISIAGTLGVIAGELANKAAQAAASGEEEQPTEETVYVLNPSHKLFNLEINKPVTLNVNGYRVTQEGYQIEKGALISISLPPDLAEYFNLQTTGSNGQVSCIITLLKIPSASFATLEVNGVFPHGKANTQVQLAFKMKFAISPVNSPNITYSEKEKRWQAPELVASFRDPVQNTPIKVGFYYGFTDPPLTFDPDILEVKEGYSSDDGLTYNFMLKVKDDINLETFFGEDLTEDDGRVMVNVVVKDEKGKEYPAKTELQVHPQLKMIAYAYDPDKGKAKNNRPETPYQGLELKDTQFIVDGMDVLPLLFFFVRTDKEAAEGDEYLSAVDLVDVLSVKFTAGKLPDPEANDEDSGDGLFAYRVRSSDFIPYTRDEEKNYSLEVEPVMRAGAPKNIGLAGMSHLIFVSPQFMKFHFWVVPGQYRGTSEAFAYVQLYPLKTGVPNLPLSLEIENPPNSDRGFLELVNGDREQNTREPDISTSDEYLPLAKGSACWGLRYSGMSWDNLNPSVFGASSPSEYRVICTGPKSDTGPIWQTSLTINVGQNINTLLSDLLGAADNLQLNNPYWKDSVIPYFIRGALTNIISWFVPEYQLYVCKEMRERIIDWLVSRSNYLKGDDPKKVQSMIKMNGIEYELYQIYAWHVWAGIFLSGSEDKHAKALDPWWE